MSVQVIRKRDQATGAFDFGRILENKPLGFPHEGGLTKPVSNLFYWAHAWSDHGGLIDKHPHQGFEIMSYVIDGTISHYDNKMDAWKNLSKGDAQLIKSGNGITHAEKLLPGAHIFQIWFDPDLNKSMSKPASYTDFQADKFPLVEKEGMVKKVVVGENSPIDLDSTGVEISELRVKAGDHAISTSSDSTYGVYVISGQIDVDGEAVSPDDFIQVKQTSSFDFKVNNDAVLFVLKVSNEVAYKTYAQMQGVA
ncbi:MAG: pirin family protein [Cyclobacteriaceae bacterium]